MTALLVQDRERARLGQMAVAATRDRRGENWTAILQQGRPLFPQIDLAGSFRAQPHGCSQKYCGPDNNPHASFNPARRVKVAEVISGEHRLPASSIWLLAESHLSTVAG